jgi:two-component system cell cycle response regulator
MVELLRYSLLVEPDRQRLGHFVMLATQALGGSLFQTSAHLNDALPAIRQSMQADTGKIDVALTLHDSRLQLSWPAGSAVVNQLPSPPETDKIQALTRLLHLESENADPSLLKLRNQEISAELEHAMAAAEAKMHAMEAALERKRQELETSIRQAETDGLTGLFNRAAFDDRLGQAVATSQASGKPLCLLLLDLDFFKQVNDTHGHQYGDQYLKRMAEVMRGAIRQQADLPCRIGGDEFALVCQCPMNGAKRIARKVLDGMDQRVSIGIAEYRPEESMASLIERADAALYLAKGRGRNQYARDDEIDAERAHG